MSSTVRTRLVGWYMRILCFLQSSRIISQTTIVVDGQIVGTWKRTFNKDAVDITSDLFTSVSEAQNRAIAAAVERYSRFVGKSISN